MRLIRYLQTQQLIIDLHKELHVIERDANHIHLNTVASGAMKLFQLIDKLQKQEDAQGHSWRQYRFCYGC